MSTIDDRYEYGIEDTMLGTCATMRKAVQAALAVKSDGRRVYVYDRMTRPGSPELWYRSGDNWVVAEYRKPQPDAGKAD